MRSSTRRCAVAAFGAALLHVAVLAIDLDVAAKPVKSDAWREQIAPVARMVVAQSKQAAANPETGQPNRSADDPSASKSPSVKGDYLSIDEVDTGALPLRDWSIGPELSKALIGHRVEVRLWIDVRGKVRQAEVAAASLDETSKQSVRSLMMETVFQPALLRGRAVASFRRIELAAAPPDAI